MPCRLVCAPASAHACTCATHAQQRPAAAHVRVCNAAAARGMCVLLPWRCLARAGCVRFGGHRIAGLSGTYVGAHYEWGHFERLPYDERAVKSIYHVRRLHVHRLMQVRSGVRWRVARGAVWYGLVEWGGPGYIEGPAVGPAVSPAAAGTTPTHVHVCVHAPGQPLCA